MPTLQYYLIAYLDLLGQSQKLRQLTRLPKTDEEKRQTIDLLASTALTVRQLRESFDTHFRSTAPSPEVIESVLPEHREDFRRALSLQPWYRGFSDSVVITVPLAGREPVEQVAALFAAYRVMGAVSVVSLNIFSNLGVALRGGIEVGLGVEVFEREYYGRALLEAYLLERDRADYPRVLVGSALLSYLEAMNGATFDSQGLTALAKDTVQGCRELLLVDPDDGLPAVDPLWIVGAKDDPHYKDYLTLASQMMSRADDLKRDFRAHGNERLARRYGQLVRLLSTSPNAPPLP